MGRNQPVGPRAREIPVSVDRGLVTNLAQPGRAPVKQRGRKPGPDWRCAAADFTAESARFREGIFGPAFSGSLLAPMWLGQSHNQWTATRLMEECTNANYFCSAVDSSRRVFFFKKHISDADACNTYTLKHPKHPTHISTFGKLGRHILRTKSL